MKIKFVRIIANKEQLFWDWSGTVTNLKKALRKQSQLEEVNIFYDWQMTLNKILVKCHLKKDDFNAFNIKHANQLVKVNKTPIVTFDEFPNGHYSYIYQDLIVDYLLDIYKNDWLLFENSNFQGLSKKTLLKRQESQLTFYNSGANIFTMSHWLKDYIQSKDIVPEERVHYVGAGINIDVSKIDTSQKIRNKFLFIGKDFYRKGGDLVYKAFLELSKKYSDVELYIIGPKNLDFTIDSESIYFLGELATEDIQKYFNLCDYFVMPSRFEAYGLVFLEALTFGLPCIGRRLHEMPYLIEEGKTGYLLDKNEETPEILSQMMEKLLSNNDINRRVENNRDYYISEYSWDTVAKRMLNVINKDTISE